MARKLTKEELLKIELGDFYELADDTVKKKALAKIHKKYKAAEQAKAARTTRTTKKTARAACDSPKEKHVGRPRTNPEGTRVWGLRVTLGERYMIKHILDYTRKIDGEPCFVIRVVGEPNIEELRITRFADDY